MLLDLGGGLALERLYTLGCTLLHNNTVILEGTCPYYINISIDHQLETT